MDKELSKFELTDKNNEVPQTYFMVSDEGILTEDNIRGIFEANDDMIKMLSSIYTKSTIKLFGHDYECFTIDEYDIDTIKLLLSYKASEFQEENSRTPTEFNMLEMNIEIIYNFDIIKEECFNRLKYETLVNTKLFKIQLEKIENEFIDRLYNMKKIICNEYGKDEIIVPSKVKLDNGPSDWTLEMIETKLTELENINLTVKNYNAITSLYTETFMNAIKLKHELENKIKNLIS